MEAGFPQHFHAVEHLYGRDAFCILAPQAVLSARLRSGNQACTADGKRAVREERPLDMRVEVFPVKAAAILCAGRIDGLHRRDRVGNVVDEAHKNRRDLGTRCAVERVEQQLAAILGAADDAGGNRPRERVLRPRADLALIGKAAEIAACRRIERLFLRIAV